MSAAALPNILLIITDQHRADHLGCYGNAVVRTPHIDSLAARGVAFDRFYVASAICMPNRATLMTGRMPTLHGVRHNGIPLSLDATVFTELLRGRGYHTAMIGKSHLQNMSEGAAITRPAAANGTATVAGLEEATHSKREGGPYDQERKPFWTDPAHDVALPYYGFEHVELCDGHGDETFGHYGRWLLAHDPGGDDLRGRKNATPDPRYSVPQSWRTRLPVELYPSSYIAERAEAYLAARAASEDGLPFFLKCSFPDPHHPFTPPGRYWDMHDADDMVAPVTCRPPDDGAPPHVRALHAERAAGTQNLNSPSAIAIDEREAREAIALTYGMIALIDDCVGRILAALERNGFGDTIVIFTTDHGDLMGEHGLLFKAPIHYQGLVRVPFIWAEPGVNGGRRVDQLAGTIDIARTLLDRTATAPYNGLQGRSLLGHIEGRASSPAPEAMLIEEDGQRTLAGLSAPARCRTLVTERWRLSLYAGETWGELYDLHDDPLEKHNRWFDEAYRAERAELIERLAREIVAAADRSPLPTSLA